MVSDSSTLAAASASRAASVSRAPSATAKVSDAMPSAAPSTGSRASPARAGRYISTIDRGDQHHGGADQQGAPHTADELQLGRLGDH